MSDERPSVVRPVRVMIYSDDRVVRQEVRLALGRRVAADLPELEVFDTATAPAFFTAARAGQFDMCVLDGEAVPLGGMGIAHELKEILPDSPPVVLLVARVADAWLASWSRAEALCAYPIDPMRLSDAVAKVMREHVLPRQAVTA